MKFFIVSALLMIFSSFVTAMSTQNNPSVTGYWQTFDDKTKKPSSVIAIAPEGQYYAGRIKTTFPVSQERLNTCALCKGDQKNKPIIGLMIIKNMACQPSYCKGGTILDPRNGKVYHATMRLINDGRYLKVRGYIGIPMFGKSVIWHRVSGK